MTPTEPAFNYKNFFKNYGFFLAIIVVLFLILFYSVYLARKPWQTHLKTQIEKVLDQKEPNAWSVGNFKRIDNPFTLSAACYEARYRRTGDYYHVVIVRIQTFYGPVSAVFTVDKNENAQFIGYSSLNGRIATQLLNNSTDKRLEYWINKVPDIIREKGN